MARVPQLEAILEAWFDFKHSPSSERREKRRKLDDLLEAALSDSGARSISKHELMVALDEEYRTYAKAKKLEERRRLSRLK